MIYFEKILFLKLYTTEFKILFNSIGACSHQRAIYYFVESIHRLHNCISQWNFINGTKCEVEPHPGDPVSERPLQPVGAFVSTECDSYENFVNGNCVEYGPKVLMGEGALASM